MKILAIEQSSPTASLAVLEDTAVLREERWTDTDPRKASFFSALLRLCNETGLDPAAIDLFAVGLGPGSFSGLRVAVSAARAMALPGSQPVLGVSSAEALAWALLRETGAAGVTIVGDARRGQVWISHFRREAEDVVQAEPLSVIRAGELGRRMLPGFLVATPDWVRLCDTLRGAVPGETLVAAEASPRASVVGALVFRRRDRLSGDPLPIYVHPPVFVTPREGVRP
jgi:tRNA threonylcarbamoyladenosine biosynthesis protein TsaB